jgi:hypothetical protein
MSVVPAKAGTRDFSHLPMEVIRGLKAHGTRRRGGRTIGMRLKKTRTDAFMTIFRRYFDEEMVKIIFLVSYEAGEGVKSF